MRYIELRLLTYLDCELKHEKIARILRYFNTNNFVNNLTIFQPEGGNSELLFEVDDKMSLTIDEINDKLRFKLWNGSTVFWLYHVDDLLDVLETRRDEFTELYDKYEPITQILLDFKTKWKTSINHISYDYTSNDDVDLVYYIEFTKDVEEINYASNLLRKIDNEISLLGEDIIKDLNFRIEHSFEKPCTPCEQARMEREKYDREN